MIIQARSNTVKIFLSSIFFIFLLQTDAKDIKCKRLDSSHPYAKRSRRKERVGNEFKYTYRMNDLYEKKPIYKDKIIIDNLEFFEKIYKLDPSKDITCDLNNSILICPKRPVGKGQFDSQKVIFPLYDVPSLENVPHEEIPPEDIIEKKINLYPPFEIFKFFNNFKDMFQFDDKAPGFRLSRFDDSVFYGKVFLSNSELIFSPTSFSKMNDYCTIQLNVKDWPLYKGDLTIPPYKQKKAAKNQKVPGRMR